MNYGGYTGSVKTLCLIKDLYASLGGGTFTDSCAGYCSEIKSKINPGSWDFLLQILLLRLQI